MKIDLPRRVEQIISVLQGNGYEAFAVGGCVRDSLLHREPKDWDITTQAKPNEIKRLFRRTVDTGIQHGTVTVLLDDEGYEVTTYRVDGEYEDARHPKSVSFSMNLAEDLQRRDFTINAMAYNDEVGLVDLYSGEKDLLEKRIRCVGEARERFSEDALRILRAFRFSAQLGFSVEKDTLLAARELAGQLQRISVERISAELRKLLTSDHPELLLTMWENGISDVFFPEFGRMLLTDQHHPLHYANVGYHTMDVLTAVRRRSEFARGGEFSEKDFCVLRYAALFHDIGKPLCRTTDKDGVDHFMAHPELGAKQTEEILNRFRLENELIGTVVRLVRFHDVRMKPDERVLRRIIAKVSLELFPLLLELHYADLTAHTDPFKSHAIKELAAVFECYQRILSHGDCLDKKSLAVNGSDLIEMGMQPGPKMGECLDWMLELVLEHPDWNTRERLLKELSEKEPR